MAMSVVKAKVPKLGDKEVSINFDYGDDMKGAVALYGEAAVYNAYRAEAVIALQSRLRDWAIKGKSDAEIQQLAAQWKPGAAPVRVAGDPVAKYEAFLGTLPEDKAIEQIEKLKKLLAEKRAAKGAAPKK